MASNVEGNNKGFKAGADLSAKQFFIVKLTAAGIVGLASAATDAIIGVLQNKPTSGDNADVKLRNSAGTGKVIAGGNIAINDRLTANADGKAIATTTAGNQVFGRAIETAVAGDIFEYMPTTETV